MPDPEQPIESVVRAQMNETAAKLAADFPGKGFALLIFALEGSDDINRLNYISNASRKEILDAMRDFIDKSETQNGESSPLVERMSIRFANIAKWETRLSAPSEDTVMGTVIAASTLIDVALESIERQFGRRAVEREVWNIVGMFLARRKML